MSASILVGITPTAGVAPLCWASRPHCSQLPSGAACTLLRRRLCQATKVSKRQNARAMGLRMGRLLPNERFGGCCRFRAGVWDCRTSGQKFPSFSHGLSMCRILQPLHSLRKLLQRCNREHNAGRSVRNGKLFRGIDRDGGVRKRTRHARGRENGECLARGRDESTEQGSRKWASKRGGAGDFELAVLRGDGGAPDGCAQLAVGGLRVGAEDFHLSGFGGVADAEQGSGLGAAVAEVS